MNFKDLLHHTSSQVEELVFKEIGRCLIHMQTGLFSASRSEILHVRLIEFLLKEVTDQTESIALCMKKNGFYLLINPTFLSTGIYSLITSSSGMHDLRELLPSLFNLVIPL